jgi:hypothetical protein
MECQLYTIEGNFVAKKAETEPDFIRACILLKKRFQTPGDLIIYWSMSGPCRFDCPDIEKVSS